MTIKEKRLLEKYSKLCFNDISQEVENNNFDSEEYTEEFRDELCNLLAKICFTENPQPDIPFEEVLQKAFDSWDEERQREFLEEDWSELDTYDENGNKHFLIEEEI